MKMLFAILAVICYALAAFRVNAPVDFVAAGHAFTVAALLLPV